MKQVLTLGFCLLVMGCASSPKSESSRQPAAVSSGEMCKKLHNLEIHSHRGAWDRPENMMSAFLRAVDQGADYVEMDLQISKDNQIVVAHDAFMKKECRDANGNAIEGKIFYRSMTLAKIQSYNCGSMVTRGQAVPGETISSLDEVLDRLKDKKTARGLPLKLNIEIKYNPSEPDYYPADRHFYVDRILDVIDHSGINKDQVMIQSFDVEILKVVRERREYLRLSPLLSDVKRGIKIAQELRAELVTPHFSQVTPDMLAQFHEKTDIHPDGIKVVPWTVNDPENASKLIDWGVDGIITDNPEWFSFAKEFCTP